jgi:hypothetical protein
VVKDANGSNADGCKSKSLAGVTALHLVVQVADQDVPTKITDSLPFEVFILELLRITSISSGFIQTSQGFSPTHSTSS